MDKGNSTQFRRALQQLGIEMIAAYSPEARGRSERAFRTHQDRLVKELAAAATTDIAAANEHLQQVYLPAFNEEFEQPPREAGSTFMPVPEGVRLDNIFCGRYERLGDRRKRTGILNKKRLTKMKNPVVRERQVLHRLIRVPIFYCDAEICRSVR